MTNALRTLWNRYRDFVEGAIHGSQIYEVKGIRFWREKLFTNTILYSIPISFVALIPSVIILHERGYVLIPAYDLFTLFSISLITLNKRFSLQFRKAFVIAIFYILAIILMAVLGSFGIGSIYLLALTVFIALLFPKRVVIGSVITNTLIYVAFGIIIYFKLFNSPLATKYDLSIWMVYSSNFLFLNIALVVQIRHLIIGLETTITQEAGLRKELQAEVDERIKRNEQLAESESHYRSLFYHNPSPMWIFDADTLAFLQVNGTAIRKYGYTRAEFANMTIKDIRGVDEVGNLLEILKTTLHANNITNSTVQHARKNGEKFYAEVRCSNIKYQGKNARLVIARDITAQMHHTQAIEKQNLKLQEIAFMQSHLVRAPLCRIMGLVDIMSQNVHDKTDPEILDYLQISVHELDDIIKTIVNNTEGTIVYDGV